MKRTNMKQGQALVEFALVLPLLLLVVVGTFEFSRAFLTYAQASQAHRNALRRAEVAGYPDETIPYLDCTKMKDVAQDIWFTTSNTVSVQYQKASNGTILPCNNTGDVTESSLETGDMLQINSTGTIEFIIFPGKLDFDFQGERTIVKSLELSNNPTLDIDLDGLADNWEVSYFGDSSTQNALDDADGDGCNNGVEEVAGTNPLLSDTDGDMLGDCAETNGYYGYTLDPFSADSDDDYLPDNDEVSIYHTDPTKADSDGDGLIDGGDGAGGTAEDGEIYDYHTDPTKADTDGDGLNDGQEVLTEQTNPVVTDTDGDGLLDGPEISVYFTRPKKLSSDSDSLTDGQEVLTYGTDPNDHDTDGDTVADDDEILNLHTDPKKTDTDGDGANDKHDAVPLDPHMF